MAKNSLSDKIIQSEIRNMSIECAKVNGINLSQGFSDTEINHIISSAAKKAIDLGNNHYTRFDGTTEIRNVLSEKLKAYNKITADPEDNIIVTNGSTAALFCILYALLRQGEEVLLFEPYYGYHLNTILVLNLLPKYFELSFKENWSIDFEKLRKSITPNMKAIILNTPTNPSGKVFTREEIYEICKIAKEKNIYLITDEIYEYFLYDGVEHVSPGSYNEFKDTVITIGGYSKTFSITGWRIGYIVCDIKYKETIGFVHDLMYVCAPAPLQSGVAAGIKLLTVKFYNELKNSYSKKREIICTALSNCGLNPIIPKGAYYVLADISRVPGRNSKERVINILNKTGVASVPGVAFSSTSQGEYMARFCFAKKDLILFEAAERLRLLNL
ncbi:pyridoxal phosphate-dependent aminotransferase [Bacteroidota bacterium]